MKTVGLTTKPQKAQRPKGKPAEAPDGKEAKEG